MKLYIGVVALAALVSVALFAVVKVRKAEEEKERKRSRFQEVKRRVTYDVFSEYQEEVRAVEALLEKTRGELKELEPQVGALLNTEDQKRSDNEACQGEKKRIGDLLAAVESEVNNVNADSGKQQSSWEAEVASLKGQVTQRSTVCDFVKKDSEEGRKMCGDEVIKAEPPKAEAPKEDAPKAEAPKEDAPKVEAPKEDAPKVEAPKEDAPKVEAPKSK